MVIRFWLLASIALAVLAWVLMVPFSPPPFQASPGSGIADYRAQGLVPKAGETTISDAVGHDVFEIPETDAEHAGMADMPGMGKSTDMSADKDDADGGVHGAEAGVADTMSEAPDMTNMPEMDNSAAMRMTEDEGGHEEEEGMAGLRVLDAKMAHMAKRTIDIEMREWGFSPPNITVGMGEIVRLVVRNTGNVPHEFMLMPPQGMAAVAYRLDRADWNLTEHEAIFERTVVMPGDSFELVVQADQPGNWMYMCMFPYHMQFGMMGGLSTEGAPAMEGMSMGGMKM